MQRRLMRAFVEGRRLTVFDWEPRRGVIPSPTSLLCSRYERALLNKKAAERLVIPLPPGHSNSEDAVRLLYTSGGTGPWV